MFPVAAPVEPAVLLAEVLDEARRPDAARSLRRAERRLRRAPDDPARRLAMALRLALTHDAEGPWCDRARDLLLPLDADPWVPWQQTVTLVVHRTCPGDAWPSAELGALLLDADWASAEAATRRVHGHPTLSPRAPELHADLLEARASLHFATGDHQAAVLDAREAIALRGSSDLRLRLGLSLMPLGEEPEARAQLTVGLLLGDTQPMLTERARMALHVLATPDAPTTSPIPVGDPFPDLQLTADGASTRLHDQPGPMVVDVWATWCQPCVKAIPHLDASAPGWAARGVHLLGVSVDDRPEALAHFVDLRAPDYPMAWAGPDAMATTGLSALPAVFVLDDQHRVVGFLGGWTPATARHLEALVDIAAEAADTRE